MSKKQYHQQVPDQVGEWSNLLHPPIRFMELVSKITVSKTAEPELMKEFSNYPMNCIVVAKN